MQDVHVLFADDKDISDIRGLTKICFTFSFYAVQYINIGPPVYITVEPITV